MGYIAQKRQRRTSVGREIFEKTTPPPPPPPQSIELHFAFPAAIGPESDGKELGRDPSFRKRAGCSGVGFGLG